MGKSLIIINPGDETKIINYLKTNAHKSYIVFDNSGLLLKKTFKNHTQLKISSLIDETYLRKIDNIAYKTAKNWYLSSKQYNGIFIGELISNEVSIWLVKAIKFSTQIKKTIKKYKIETVIVIEDKSIEEKILRGLSEECNIKIVLISSLDKSKESYFNIVKRIIKKYIIKGFIWKTTMIDAFKKLAANLRPGFIMMKGIRTVLFDPYYYYENLLPQIIGQGANEIIIHSNFFDSSLNHYKRIFGLPINFFHVPNLKYDKKNIEKQTDININLVNNFSANEIDKNILILLKEFVRTQIPLAIQNIDNADYLINKYKIGLTLLPFDIDGLYKAIVLLGRRRNIITIVYQHGTYGTYSESIFPVSNKILLWDKNTVNHYKKNGISEEKITTIENPLKEYLKSFVENLDKKILRRNLSIDIDDQVVLFAAQPFVGMSSFDDYSQNNRVLFKLINLAKKMPSIKFIIKLHPSDYASIKNEIIFNYIADLTIHNLQLSKENSTKLIFLSDFVISESSTCLLEAEILGKKAIAFENRKIIRAFSPYKENNNIIKCETIDAIQQTLKSLIRSKN